MPRLNGTLQRLYCICVLSCREKTLSIELRSSAVDNPVSAEPRDVRKNCREKTLSLSLRSSNDDISLSADLLHPPFKRCNLPFIPCDALRHNLHLRFKRCNPPFIGYIFAHTRTLPSRIRLFHEGLHLSFAQKKLGRAVLFR
jgi:hypothetical protein